MRHQSSIPALHILFAIFSTIGLTSLARADDSSLPPCQTTAARNYPNMTCYVLVKREEPGSPLPIQVPGDTTVIIRVMNPRHQETLKFGTTTDEIAPQDFGAAFVKQILDPLKSLVASEQKKNLSEGQVTKEQQPVLDEQVRVSTAFIDIVMSINKATVELSCLQSYTTLLQQEVDGKPVYSCGAKPMSGTEFDTLKSATETDIRSAALSPIPVASLKAIDGEITILQTACQKLDNDDAHRSDRNACIAGLNILQSNQLRLNDSNTAIQAGRKTLLQGSDVLANLPIVTDPFTYTITRPPNRKATIKITALEAIGKTNSDVGTVVITWQQSNWTLSTGILLSSLANQTFANSLIYVNGVPDPNKLTEVTVDSIRPSVVFPAVFGSYRFYAPAKCKGKCAFLGTVGVGANLTSKTTDFGTGVSLQLGSILLTPLAHFGRQTELDHGVFVGERLGVSPPTLPTKTAWKAAFGFGISYRLPIP